MRKIFRFKTEKLKKTLVGLFVTPKETQLLRKRMFHHGIFLITMVVFNIAIKFFLKQGTFWEWVISITIGVIGIVIVLISIYGKNNLISLYFGL